LILKERQEDFSTHSFCLISSHCLAFLFDSTSLCLSLFLIVIFSLDILLSLCTSVNRNSKSYMKTYMQERRKNTVLYKQELNAKKLSRQDPNFRKKENQKQVDFNLHTCIKRVHIPHKIFYITKSNKYRMALLDYINQIYYENESRRKNNFVDPYKHQNI
jgi:hypothetical protein